MIRIILFFSLFIYSNIYATNDFISCTDRVQEGKKLLLQDEKFVDALWVFIKELETATKVNQKEEMAEDMYWISECLFQLRKLEKLELVIKLSEEFMIREHLYNTYKRLMLTKSKYLIDIGESKKAIKILLATENKNNSTDFMNEEKLIIADAYYRISELNKSKVIYEYVVSNSKDSNQIAQAYNGIGSYYFMNSKFDSAVFYFNVSLNIYIKSSKLFHIKIASVIYNLSLISNKYGDYQIEKKALSLALIIFKKKKIFSHPLLAELYGTIGNNFTIENNLGKSKYYYKKEKEMLISIYSRNRPRIINSFLNYGENYIITHNYKLAEIEILQALELTKKYYSKKHNLYMQCIVKYAEILIEKKDYNKADSLLNEVIQINYKNPNDYCPDVYLQLGNSFLAQKKYYEAISYFHKADEMYVHFFGKKNVYSIDPLTALSNTYLQISNTQEALKYANLALAHTIDSNNILFPYDHWECVLQKIKCIKYIYIKNNNKNIDFKNDIALIKNTIAEASKIKQTYYSNGSQMHYAEKMSELNVLGIYFLTHFYKKADEYFINNLLFFSENNKANLLRYKISNSESNELLPELERNKLATITDKLNYFISLNENQEDANFNINDSILRYQTLHETYTKNIEQKYPKIYNIKYGQKPIILSEIQSKLTKDCSFLVYCNDGENYYCLSISKQKIIYKICGNKSKIDSIIQQYQDRLLNKFFDLKTNILLSNFLLPKEINQNLIISSDDQIQHLSFDALYKTPAKEYLIYNHAIQYAFSVSTYFKHPEASENNDILGFFPDFSNTKHAILNVSEEQKTLQKTDHYQQFSDSLATKKIFLNNYKKAGAIHIASHLIADSISPLESSILFQKNKDDKLTINEIWKLNSNMQLVSIAACRSNYGISQTGEGNLNFAWAFHYAGAHNVLSTQWNASDKSTSSITSYFYKFLAKGKSKQEALQLAKINYLNNTDAIGAQPFFWANYCLYADNTEIHLGSFFLTKFLLFFLFVSLLSYLAIIKYRQLP